MPRHARSSEKPVTFHMSTLTETDLAKLDYGLVKAHVVKSFHGTQAAMNMVEDEGAYMRNVIFNVNVKMVRKVITSLLVEYMSNNDHDIVTPNSCIQHVGDFFSHHNDGGQHVRKKHHEFIKKTIQKILDKTLAAQESSSDSEQGEDDGLSSGDESE